MVRPDERSDDDDWILDLNFESYERDAVRYLAATCTTSSLHDNSARECLF